jgi:hypothetical protein
MPAPDRDPPYNISPLAFNPVKGIVGYYSASEIDAYLANISGGDSAITLHAGAVPDAGADTPKGLEDAFAVLADGLHYYKDVGTLVSITRQQYQTTIVLSGQLTSFAKIVKSEAGLPTTQNPSLIVLQTAEGQWLKLTSDELDKPFGNPQRVDIFALGGGDPSTVDLSDYYTKTEVDGRISGKADQSEFAAFQGQYGTLESEFREYFRLLNQGFATVVQKDDVYTKPEVDSKLSGYAPIATTTLITTQLQAVFDSIYTKPEADDRYAQKIDNTQNLVANAVLAKGYAFGDTVGPNNPGLVYTDTGEGYGPRLVLDTPAGMELIPYQSDFEPIKERLDALESKAAPAIDLSPYVTLVDAAATYAEKAKTYTKTECDGKFLTIVDIDQFAYRADVYTQKQCDDRFIRIDQAFSKIDFDNQMALMLYSRKQVDDRLAAINPLGSPSINNPALSEFKQSVLDEVKLMLVGGTKPPPPDIDWTPIIRMDGTKETVSTEIQARMLGGFIELKGTLTFAAGTAEWNPLRLPPQFPLADLDANYPLAMRLVGSAVTYGFCSVSSKNRDIRVSPGARSNEAAFSGIRWKAAY